MAKNVHGGKILNAKDVFKSGNEASRWLNGKPNRSKRMPTIAPSKKNIGI